MNQPRKRLRRPAQQDSEQQALPEVTALAAGGILAAQAARAARERMLDEALAPLEGEAETLGTTAPRAELRGRESADEEYVRTFRQPGGE